MDLSRIIIGFWGFDWQRFYFISLLFIYLFCKADVFLIALDKLWIIVVFIMCLKKFRILVLLITHRNILTGLKIFLRKETIFFLFINRLMTIINYTHPIVCFRSIKFVSITILILLLSTISFRAVIPFKFFRHVQFLFLTSKSLFELKWKYVFFLLDHFYEIICHGLDWFYIFLLWLSVGGMIGTFEMG